MSTEEKIIKNKVGLLIANTMSPFHDSKIDLAPSTPMVKFNCALLRVNNALGEERPVALAGTRAEIRSARILGALLSPPRRLSLWPRQQRRQSQRLYPHQLNRR